MKFLTACGISAMLLLYSCSGYRFEPSPAGASSTVSVSVPYIAGDTAGVFTDELIYALGASGKFTYAREDGDVELKVALGSGPIDCIGYRFDRKGKENKRLKNLIPTEERLTLSAQVTLLNPSTECPLYGPKSVSASTDYDYYDFNSISDLSYTGPNGQRQSSIAFSLGQLDSAEGARIDATQLLYRKLAVKIVDALSACAPSTQP